MRREHKKAAHVSFYSHTGENSARRWWHVHSYCDSVQWTCVAFETAALRRGRSSVPSQSAAAFKAALMRPDGDKTTIRCNQFAISLRLNGVKLPITCSLFVIIQQLTVMNQQRLEIYCKSVAICMHRNSYEATYMQSPARASMATSWQTVNSHISPWWQSVCI